MQDCQLAPHTSEPVTQKGRQPSGSILLPVALLILFSHNLAWLVQIVDAVSGAVLVTLSGDLEPVTALVYGPDGGRIYTASRSLQQRCWDLSGDMPTVVRAWKGHKVCRLEALLEGVNKRPAG